MNVLALERNALPNVSEMTKEDLRTELLTGLALTASCLWRLALIVKELESRGEDIQDLKIGMMRYLRLIAYGQLLPEVLVRFSCAPRLIDAVGQLPMPDQQELAEGKHVLLAVYGHEGAITHRMVDPLHLQQAQVYQVFAKGKIRTQAEQALILEKQRTESKRKPSKVGELKLDYERRCVSVGRRTIMLDELEEAVRFLKNGGKS